MYCDFFRWRAPLDVTVKPHTFQPAPHDASSEKVSHLVEESGIPIDPRIWEMETEVFRMKALRLLDEHEIPFASSAHKHQSVRTTEITIVDQHDGEATLSMKIDLETQTSVIIQGSFKRRTQAFSIPLPASFTLTKKPLPETVEQPAPASD